MNLSNRRRGFKAKKQGDAFENLFASKCAREGLCIAKIPTGIHVTGKRGGKVEGFQVKTPFDYVIGSSNRAAFIDLKSLDASSLPKSKITPHQLESLVSWGEGGFVAGYVVNLRKVNMIVFFDYKQLRDLRPQRSLQALDGFCLGSKEDFKVSKLLGGL